MKDYNKTAIGIIIAVIASVLFISCSVVFEKTRAKKEMSGATEFEVPGAEGMTAFEETKTEYDGILKIYKTVPSDNNSPVYCVTSEYDGFSQKALIGAFFENDELLGVNVISKEGVPSYYDERALGKEDLSLFCGKISADNSADDGDRDFIEIEALSENDAAGNALLKSVDDCCKAYCETVLKKAVSDNG